MKLIVLLFIVTLYSCSSNIKENIPTNTSTKYPMYVKQALEKFKENQKSNKFDFNSKPTSFEAN